MKKSISAGGVVINGQGMILVVNQRGNSWSLPKGKLEEGENHLQAAKREIFEESGVKDLNFVKELGTYKRHKIGKEGGDDPNEKKVITLFLFTTTQVELKPIDPHNPEARWVAKEGVPSLLTHEKDKEFFKGLMDNGDLDM